MFCRNAGCDKKTFAEKFGFVGAKGKKSFRLEKEIISIAMNSSSVEAAKMLSRSTVKISSGTVRNVLKKNGAAAVSRELITHVCIDDFAVRKGRSYGSIMVDMKANRIVDIIETRDGAPVTEWLKRYPNLEVVSRDGSVTYKNAVEAAHPKAVQVSDRFHLVKNLTEYAMDYLRKHLKAQVMIPSSKPAGEHIGGAAEITAANENRKLTLTEKYEKIEEMRRAGCSKTHICRTVNMDARTYEKLISMSESDRAASFTTNLKLAHEERVELKMQRVNEARELKAAGFSNRAISRKVSLDHRTVAKYIDVNFNPAHASYGQKKTGILSRHMQEIDSMLDAGMMGTAVTQRLSEQGYTGSASTVRHYIADWKKRRKHIYAGSSTPDGPMEIIERTDVFKLLFHPLEKAETPLKRYALFIRVFRRYTPLYGISEHCSRTKLMMDLLRGSRGRKP